jgi:hypothetical protein
MTTEQVPNVAAVTPPIDCDLIDGDLPLPELSYIWDSQRQRWSQADRGATLAIYGPRYTAACRCRYSRQNPPPIPSGYTPLPPGQITTPGDLVYIMTRGWVDEHFGFASLEQSGSGILAIAVPSEIKSAPPKDGQWELVTDDSLPDRLNNEYAVGGGEGNYFLRVPPSQVACRPIYRRLCLLGDLPFTRIDNDSELIKAGDIVFDEKFGWMPWVGGAGDAINVVIDVWPWVVAVARLKPGLLADGMRMVGFHSIVSNDTELLIASEGGGYGWRAPTKEELSQPAWRLTHVWGVRVANKKATPIPAIQFMNKRLMEMVRAEPGSDVVRGLVRGQLHIIIPKSIQATGDANAVMAFIEERYTEMHPGSRDAEVDLIRVGQGRAEPDTTELFVSITRRTRWSEEVARCDLFEGNVEIPNSIYDLGTAAIRQYIADNARSIVPNLSITEGDNSTIDTTPETVVFEGIVIDR